MGKAVRKQKGHRSASRTATMHLDAVLNGLPVSTLNYMYIFNHPNLSKLGSCLPNASFGPKKLWEKLRRPVFQLIQQSEQESEKFSTVGPFKAKITDCDRTRNWCIYL